MKEFHSSKLLYGNDGGGRDCTVATVHTGIYVRACHTVPCLLANIYISLPVLNYMHLISP